MPNPPRFSRFNVLSVTPNIGAEIEGIDLALAPDAQAASELRFALAHYDVLFFRGQTLTPEAQVRIAQVFGEPAREKTYFPALPEHELVELVETKEGGPRYNTDQWHNDTSYIADVPAGSVLVARVLPESGGDTLWASARKVYQALPPALAQWLETLTASHSIDHSGWPEIIRREGEEKYRDIRARHLPVSHPIVKTHAVTGEKYIFVNPKYTERIDGLSRNQGDAVLKFLFAQFERPEFQVRLRWSPGTVVVWDNHSTNHYAVPDYLPAYRLLHRVTF
ncbi:MAG: TauD/TfdA family dioxygenase [Zoogloeaceae bacterium]|nr:TauD/TfdA family dioxygenase [Zoogloeaceae bacterium]